MPIYEKSTKELLHDWAAETLRDGQVFSKTDALNWFSTHYPKIKKPTVSMHLDVMSTNNGKLRCHHPSVKPGSNHDLFFKVSPSRYRLYASNSDPAPEYPDSVTGTDLLDQHAEVGEEGEQDLETKIGAETLKEAKAFAYEKDLQNFLFKNISLLEEGLKVYWDEDGELNGREYDAGGRRIDLLCVDKAGGFVVVELKVARAYDRVIGQTARYISWVEENLADGSPVRGIIVAAEINDDLKLAARQVPKISLFEYQMTFSVSAADG